jgi:putative peptidoglycan lipid II flippase
LDGALRQIAFFVIPSAVVFLALGDVVVGALYQTGAFTRQMTLYVWAILAGSAVGLLASTWGRLYASTYYAVQDTRTPLRFALVRVGLTLVMGYVFAMYLPGEFGLSQKWGAPGITLASGVAAGIEFLLLRRGIARVLGRTGVPGRFLMKLWVSALAAAAAGWVVRLAVDGQHPIVVALFSLGMYGIAYFAVAAALGVPHAGRLLSRLSGFLRR